jgi:hypothetical protein
MISTYAYVQELFRLAPRSLNRPNKRIICVVHESERCFYLSILEENGVLLTFIENLMGGPY